MSSVFQPKFSIIESIIPGITTTVTFTENCDFTNGEIVSFRVSKLSGMKELNNQQARVLSHTSDSIIIGIDSRNYTPFIFVDENELIFPAMAVPAGSGIIPDSNPSTINLEDAFDNVPVT